MIDSSLDSSGLAETLAAIARQADYLDVTVHAPDRELRPMRHASIEQARAALLEGTAVAVKLSYRVADAAWSDTLTRRGDRYRWLRVRRSLGGWLLGGD